MLFGGSGHDALDDGCSTYFGGIERDCCGGEEDTGSDPGVASSSCIEVVEVRIVWEDADDIRVD